MSQFGVDLPLTAFGDLRVAELSPQFQGSFEYTVDNTEIITNTVVAGGTVTQGNAMAVCATSTTTASTAKLISKRHAKYKAGMGGLLRMTALFTTPVAATEQYLGLMDEEGSSAAFKNGLALGYDGTTFGFHRFSNDTKNTTAIANWDDPLDGTGASGITLDQTKLNVFFIGYEYLGSGPMLIWMQHPTERLPVLVHEVDYGNTNTEPSTHNPNYHYTMWVNNKATTSNLIVKTGSYAYFVEGRTTYIEQHQPQFGTGEKQKTSVTTEVAIVTIRNKATYQGKTNFIDIVLESITSSIEASSANNLGKVRLVRNATLAGVPSYTDINTSDSVVDFDVAGTTVTGGKEFFPLPLAGKNDSAFVDLTSHTIIIGPGETMTLAGSSANSATINASQLWKELF